MANEHENERAGEAEASESAKGVHGVFSLLLPADMPIWQEARRLVSDKNIRVEDLATCTSQDPVIVIELIKVANAMFFSGGKSPITSARTAIMRLGSDVVLETLEKMKERPAVDTKEMSHWFELHRSRCKRTSIIARMLSEALARTLTDDCQVAGLLLNIGDMLAVMHFADKYVKLAEDQTRSGIVYRLAQDFKFDVERVGVTYLRRQGVPEALLFAIDRDARSRAPERVIMKPLCMAAGEIVEAFDANRWDKIAPGKTLPPKSALRSLQMAEPQYLKLYERASEYLFAARALEERNRQQAAGVADTAQPVASDAAALQNEITNLLNTSVAPAAKPAQAAAPAAPSSGTAKKETTVATVDSALSKGDEFSFAAAKSSTKTVARVQKAAPVVPPPTMRSNAGSKVVSDIAGMLNAAETSEQLLTQLLQMLVDNGPFEKSALIVVSRDRKKAIVVAARGPNIGNGQKLDLDDPLSPLAQCFSKVQSFGTRSNKVSPFGSKTFALSPIDADHETPVALYADCGNDGSISFEARRVFRTVVEILNQKLPQIPGGIPVELPS